MSAEPWTEMRAACLIWYDVRPTARLVMPRFTPPLWWECDVAVVLKGSGFWHEYEIKLSLSDFRADKKKGNGGKHEALSSCSPPLRGPNRFWYVVPAELAEAIGAELPAWAGLAVLRHSDRGHEWLDRGRKPPLRHREPASEGLVERAETSSMYRMWAALDRLHGAGKSDLWAGPGTSEPDSSESPNTKVVDADLRTEESAI